MRLFIATCVAALSTIVYGFDDGAISYDGYKAVRVRANARSVSTVRQQLAGLDLEPWTPERTGGTIDVAIPPEKLASFEALHLHYRVLHDDLGAAVAAESDPASAAAWSAGKRQVDDLAWYDSFHPYEEHVQYFKDLQARFPNNSETVSTGTSYEGRDLHGLHLWGEGGPGKPVVLYHGTVHAREWITTMTVEYLALQVILKYQSGDESTRSYLNNYDFYIFPIVNPDGFVHSQTKNRFWRKSREPSPTDTPFPVNASCAGVDLNRNWAYTWAPNTGGSSPDPCSDMYAGSGPSSTPENKGLSALVDRLRGPDAGGGAGPGIKLYVDFHAAAAMLLYPAGADETRCAPPEETAPGRWARTGARVSDAIRAHDADDTGTVYTFGPAGAALYKMTGAALDHVYAVGGARSSWLVELPSRAFGFVVPPERIRPIVEEMAAGQEELLALVDEVFFDGVGA